MNAWKLEVGAIQEGQLRRMITCGFVHLSQQHLLFNMIALVLFGYLLEDAYGPGWMLLIYFISLLASSAFVYYTYRKYPQYSAVGASGAVAGLVSAVIVLMPEVDIVAWGIIPLPSWLYGFLYIVYTIYKSYRRNDGICHEAHAMGSLAGLVMAILYDPSTAWQHYVPVLSISLPMVLYLLFFIKTDGESLYVVYLYWVKKWSRRNRNREPMAKKRSMVQQTPGSSDNNMPEPSAPGANNSSRMEKDQDR
ncbi:MAG: rhomboid family intramembrane serine protease [Cytophagaceae bacterium]|jgi:membrane associated rhomboid family serine protease|nr:rhomboid family intramembrane serine protease [Cytophagaceae bacterium]